MSYSFRNVTFFLRQGHPCCDYEVDLGDGIWRTGGMVWEVKPTIFLFGATPMLNLKPAPPRDLQPFAQVNGQTLAGVTDDINARRLQDYFLWWVAQPDRQPASGDDYNSPQTLAITEAYRAEVVQRISQRFRMERPASD